MKRDSHKGSKVLECFENQSLIAVDGLMDTQEMARFANN